MSQRTTRSRKADGPLLTLEDASKKGTKTALKLNEEQKERLRVFVNAYLMKQGGPVDTKEIMVFLEEKCIGKSKVQSEYTVICDIYNSGVPLASITALVRNYIKNILKRDVSTLAMFPEGNVRLTVYKQMTYGELIKYYQNKLDRLTEKDKEEFALALNDPDSVLFQSVLEMVESGTEKGFKTVQDIIATVPGFDINTHKDGKTLFMAAAITLLGAVTTHDDKEIKRGVVFLEYLAKLPALQLTQVHRVEYRINTKKMVINTTPLFLLYYIAHYYRNRLDTETYDKIYNKIINPLVKKWKMPTFYLEGLGCPGKCYGTIKTEGEELIVLDNVWFTLTYEADYLRSLIRLAGFDIKAGHGTKNVKDTLFFQSKALEKDITGLEQKNTLLEGKINSVRTELHAIHTILSGLKKEQKDLETDLGAKRRLHGFMDRVYERLTEEGREVI
jgi:hypothetical protein